MPVDKECKSQYRCFGGGAWNGMEMAMGPESELQVTPAGKAQGWNAHIFSAAVVVGISLKMCNATC